MFIVNSTVSPPGLTWLQSINAWFSTNQWFIQYNFPNDEVRTKFRPFPPLSPLYPTSGNQPGISGKADPVSNKRILVKNNKVLMHENVYIHTCIQRFIFYTFLEKFFWIWQFFLTFKRKSEQFKIDRLKGSVCEKIRINIYQIHEKIAFDFYFYFYLLFPPHS